MFSLASVGDYRVEAMSNSFPYLDYSASFYQISFFGTKLRSNKERDGG